MRMGRPLLVAVVGLTVVGVAVAAPGDPKKVIVPAVQAKAKAINVHRADLAGAGWVAKPSGNDRSSSPRCSYYTPDQSDLTENGDASAPDFTLPSESFVSSTVGIFKTAAQGRIAYARVVKPALPRCLAEIFQKGAGGSSKVTVVSAAKIDFPHLAEKSSAYRVVAKLKVSATASVKIYLDFVTMNRGKVDAVIFFAGIGNAFANGFERAVAAKVAARVAIA